MRKRVRGWRRGSGKRCEWLRGGQALVKHGIEQSAAFGLGRRELRFQSVAKGHQLIHLGYDAILFGEGWKGDQHHFKYSDIDVFLRRGWSEFNKVCFCGSHEVFKVSGVIKFTERNEADDTIRDTRIKTKDRAIRNVCGNCDAHRALRP